MCKTKRPKIVVKMNGDEERPWNVYLWDDPLPYAFGNYGSAFHFVQIALEFQHKSNS